MISICYLASMMNLLSFPTRRSSDLALAGFETRWRRKGLQVRSRQLVGGGPPLERKGTRLNARHLRLSYAAFCFLYNIFVSRNASHACMTGWRWRWSKPVGLILPAVG